MGEDPRSFSERMVIEPGQVEFNEHSKHSGAKKTVEVFPSLAPDPADATKTIDPVEIAGATGEFILAPMKAYRLISDGSLRFKLSTITLAAAATDTYLPADTSVIVKSGQFNRLTYVRTGGTFTQIVEVR